MKEIIKAELYDGDNYIIELTIPKLKKRKGQIFIDCYIDKNFFSDSDSIFNDSFKKLQGKIYKIKASNKRGGKTIFNSVINVKSNYPSFKFKFLCIDYLLELQSSKTFKKLCISQLSSIVIEGLDLQFTNTSETIRKRHLFGKDESRTLSLELDNLELHLNLFFKKRYYDLNIGIIKHPHIKNAVILKFFGEFKIPYKIYYKIRKSLIFFISYIAGNNIIIREENFIHDQYEFFFKEYSIKQIKKLNTNSFLPISNAHFRHKNIIHDYVQTFSNFLLLDKELNLSEIIYLINQSKNVNIESSFFIQLISIEKLSNKLLSSRFTNNTKTHVIDNDLYKDLKDELTKSFDEIFKKKINHNEYLSLKSKINNLNIRNNTDFKVENLLEFCEISNNSEIDKLFPKLRNLAIHQGEISFPDENAHDNHETLFLLLNSIICNMLQYKGIRFIKRENSINHISKKEKFKIDYKNYYG